ncbi:hypothetical protein V6N12_030921 [Hibiscus sabdariffa]|uniref:Uncharacterized protein n=1 Tax=Hibiscus sabdariffa TaxID=183260 RepID=A0ABR2E7E5_9ROSI
MEKREIRRGERVYGEEKRTYDNGSDGGNGGANKPPGHEIVEGLWRREAEDQSRSIERGNIKQSHAYAGNNCHRLR